MSSTVSAALALAPVQPPSLRNMLLELRVFLEAGRTALQWPFLPRPCLKGRTVLVLPGFCASDASTWALRRYLRKCGASVHAWELGINRGPRGDLMQRLSRRIRQLARSEGRPVTLVGWSLGGLLARVAAGRDPGAVEQVITLGSPLSGEPGASRLQRLFNLVCGRLAPRRARSLLRQAEAAAVTSIYSRSDGVVAWQASDPLRVPGAVRAIEVDSSHLGMALNARVLAAVAAQIGSAAAA